MSTLPQLSRDFQLIPPELDDDDDLFAPGYPQSPCRDPVPALPFAEWVERQSDYYRALGTGAGDWLADRLDADAATARLVRASCPAEFDEREGELIDSHQASLLARGYDAAIGDYGLPRW